jgi:glutamate:GABA antiporter
MDNNAKILGLPSLIFLSVVAIFSLRTLPIMAQYGTSLIFYYLVAGLLFFLPSALVCAELATAWPKQGGLYVWVQKAFGHRAAFFALWLEWVNNVVAWPASLIFIATSLAYVLMPSWMHHKSYIIICVLCVFWVLTWINLLGVKTSTRLSSIGLIFGLLLPTSLIIILGAIWLAGHHAIEIKFTAKALIPHFDTHNMALFIAVMLGFAGIHFTAFYANLVKKPQRNFPRAMLLATFVIIILSILGSLAIAVVIPKEKISLITGLIQSLQAFLQHFHLNFLLPIVILLFVIGSLAVLNAWIGGPAKALQTAAFEGDIPAYFARQNKHHAPSAILFAQAIIVSIICVVFLFLPSLKAAFWLVIDLSAIMSLIVYLILFFSCVRLRYTHADVHRAYRIPGGRLGLWLVTGIGSAMCCIGVVFGFMPLGNLHHVSTMFYDLFLIVALIVLTTPVWFIGRHHVRNK